LSDLFRRPLETEYRSFHIATMPVMMRKFRDVLVNLFLVDNFNCGSNALVKAPASFQEDGAICDLLGQRMLERIFKVANRGLLVDELARLQVIELAS
jgi:hypothetical protein